MSRERILGEIRRSLKRREALDGNTVRALEARTAAIRPHVQPAFDEPLVERLLRKHLALHGSAERIASSADIVAAVVAYQQQHQLPPALVAAKRAPLSSLTFEGIEVAFRPAVGSDRLSLVVAEAAIAETGTVVLVSGAGAPMTHHYLPEHHLVVVPESKVVRWQEDAWTLLQRRPDFPPRGMAMISGPSKTADVEQTIEYGAHGPRNVHLLVLDDTGEA